MMKKTLVAIAALAVVGSAVAEVTLSGGIGIDYGKANGASGYNGGASLGSNSANAGGFENSDAGATNLAFKSVEDLGGGLKLTAYIQQRFASNTGTSGNSGNYVPLVDVATGKVDASAGNGVSVPRGAQNVYLNLAGSFGSVSVGRLLMGNQGDAFAQYGNSVEFGDIDATGNRHDNTVAYYSPTYMGVSATVSSTVNSGTTAENQYVQIKYANGPLAASYAQDKNQQNDATRLTYRTVAGSYDMKTVKLFVTNGEYGTVALPINSTSIGVQVPMGAATVKAMGVTGDTSAYVLGVDYALSKKTGLFADFANTDGTASSVYRMGMRTSF
jgi:predicted porin